MRSMTPVRRLGHWGYSPVLKGTYTAAAMLHAASSGDVSVTSNTRSAAPRSQVASAC